MNDTERNRELCHELVATKFIFIPEFPRQPEAVPSMAGILLNLCETPDELKWLGSEVIRWEKWRGYGGLVELLEGRRRTAPERKVFHSAPPPAEVLCPICQGFGHRWDEASKKTVLCSCPEGSHPSAVGLVEAMNRKKVNGNLMQKLQGSPERRPITAEDVEFAKRQNKTQQEIEEARATLANADAAPDRKEIARETLKRYGATEARRTS